MSRIPDWGLTCPESRTPRVHAETLRLNGVVVLPVVERIQEEYRHEFFTRSAIFQALAAPDARSSRTHLTFVSPAANVPAFSNSYLERRKRPLTPQGAEKCTGTET